jgi:hypothetical protein
MPCKYFRRKKARRFFFYKKNMYVNQNEKADSLVNDEDEMHQRMPLRKNLPDQESIGED